VQPVSAVPPVSAVLQVSEVSAVKEGSATLPDRVRGDWRISGRFWGFGEIYANYMEIIKKLRKF
jgi:hypothetical protein